MALTDKLTAIGEAIREKNGTTNLLTLDEMPTAISNIETGLDTSDATAVASDIVQNKTAYVNGSKITGNVPKYSGIAMTFDSLTENTDNTITVKGTRTSNVMLSANGNSTTKVPLTNFGNATAADVAYGKTFTSASGLKISGTMTGEDSGAISGLQVASGSITLDENATEIVIDTGLSSIETVVVCSSSQSTTASNTWFWMYGNVGYCTCYVSSGTIAWRYGYRSNKISIDGGTITASEYSTTYPILPETYKWIAYGS